MNKGVGASRRGRSTDRGGRNRTRDDPVRFVGGVKVRCRGTVVLVKNRCEHEGVDRKRYQAGRRVPTPAVNAMREGVWPYE